MPEKGDIILVPFPFTDLSGQKNRPALVVSASRGAEDVIVAFISSRAGNIRTFDIPLKRSDKSFVRTGLKVESVVKVSKIATLEKKIILGELGVIDSKIQKEVDRKLKMLFKLT